MLSDQFGALVVQAHGAEDAMQHLREQDFDLILINRKLDQDYSDGIDVLKLLKANAQFEQIPVMLVTNYQEHQQAAVEAGAVLGFGKLELQAAETHQRLASILN